MNYMEKYHILYILLCYLNVSCVLNIEQNVNIISARNFRWKIYSLYGFYFFL